MKQSQQSKMNVESGFTLVEMLITVVVMGIVVSIAIPNLNRALANQRMKSATMTIYNAMKEAKTESYLRGTDISVVYTPKATDPANISLTTPNPNNPASAAVEVAKYEFNEHSEITTTASANTVIFRNSGRIANAATYTICDDDISNEMRKEVSIDTVTNILMDLVTSTECS